MYVYIGYVNAFLYNMFLLIVCCYCYCCTLQAYIQNITDTVFITAPRVQIYLHDIIIIITRRTEYSVYTLYDLSSKLLWKNVQNRVNDNAKSVNNEKIKMIILIIIITTRFIIIIKWLYY